MAVYKFLSTEITLNGTANTIDDANLVRLVNIVNQHHHITQKYANGVTKATFTMHMDSDLIIEKDRTDGLSVDSGSDVFAAKIAYKN